MHCTQRFLSFRTRAGCIIYGPCELPPWGWSNGYSEVVEIWSKLHCKNLIMSDVRQQSQIHRAPSLLAPGMAAAACYVWKQRRRESSWLFRVLQWPMGHLWEQLSCPAAGQGQPVWSLRTSRTRRKQTAVSTGPDTHEHSETSKIQSFSTRTLQGFAEPSGRFGWF